LPRYPRSRLARRNCDNRLLKRFAVVRIDEEFLRRLRQRAG
jgi:hypothetical protein